ncbi:MAG: 3-dehydroquinate synthase family protein [Bacteroidales bacterium]
MMPTLYFNDNLNYWVKLVPKSLSVLVIIDKNVLSQVSESIKLLSVDNIVHTILVDATERKKSMETCESILSKMIEWKLDRSVFVVAIGGGITTDLSGFISTIYKRGLHFGFVPTTLLAQVDASIGGKNGVNFANNKNMVGTINQPEWVFISPKYLVTLKERDLHSGLAEMLKTFILFDADMYKEAVLLFSNKVNIDNVNNDNSINDIDYSKVLKFIKKSAEYKSEVIKRDEFETGERRVLNLGHTFAHAIEMESSFSHGEAVSVGIIIVAEIAVKKKMSSLSFLEMLKKDFKNCGLPISWPSGIKKENLKKHILNDKKVNRNQIHLILPCGLEDVKDVLLPISEIL